MHQTAHSLSPQPAVLTHYEGPPTIADVVELIAIHGLESSFARQLHKSVRNTYRELVKNAKAG